MTDPTLLPKEEQDRSPFEPAPRGAVSRLARILVPVLLLAGAAGATWWLTRAEAEAHGPQAADAGQSPVMLSSEAASRIGVTYAVAERGSLTADVRTVGLVTYDETRVKTIAPKIDGYVEELFVNFTGQPVDEHEPLLRIYSPMLVTAQEELALAKRLVADVAGGTGDAARNAESLLASARRRLTNWDIPAEDIAHLEQTGEVQKTLTLRSPLSGVVVQKNVLSGQRIMAGDPVYQVADLHEVWLEGEVFERDLGAVQLGQTVTADFAAMPGHPRQGRVVFVAPTLTADTRTTRVRVSLPNHDLALKPGMYATIHIRGAARAGVLTVPRSAVLVTGKRVLVFVQEPDGMLYARNVEVGGTTDQRVEILRGLKAGETVVASATFLVDAESNLGAAMAAMASMPGMDMGAPKAPPAGDAKSAKPDPMADMPGMDMEPTKKAPPAKPDPMADMPGMDHSKMKKP